MFVCLLVYVLFFVCGFVLFCLFLGVCGVLDSWIYGEALSVDSSSTTRQWRSVQTYMHTTYLFSSLPFLIFFLEASLLRGQCMAVGFGTERGVAWERARSQVAR